MESLYIGERRERERKWEKIDPEHKREYEKPGWISKQERERYIQKDRWWAQTERWMDLETGEREIHAHERKQSAYTWISNQRNKRRKERVLKRGGWHAEHRWYHRVSHEQKRILWKEGGREGKTADGAAVWPNRRAGHNTWSLVFAMILSLIWLHVVTALKLVASTVIPTNFPVVNFVPSSTLLTHAPIWTRYVPNVLFFCLIFLIYLINIF